MPIITITSRLITLRKQMTQSHISACIIPSSDPHQSEYVAARWKRREWISGFDGSAGTVVVLQEQAGLWTDSRYFLQAEMQLEGSGILLFKEGMPGVPDYQAWIISNLPQNAVIGIDGAMFSTYEVKEMKKRFSAAGLELKTNFVPFDEWCFPPLPQNKIFIYDEKFAGCSCTGKINRIRQKIVEANADGLLLTALDEVAWVFNIRGTDVEYNPVTIAYAIISTDDVSVFIDEKKLSPEVISYFEKNNIRIHPYSSVVDFCAEKPVEYHILIDVRKVNYAIYDAIRTYVSPVEETSPVGMMKAVKNEVEISGTKNAVLKDGVALTRACYWLESELAAGRKVTEMSFAGKLHAYRAAQAHFFSESFSTITGFAAKGAIVHCVTSPENDMEIRSGNLFLVDSGGNYLDGTTDITRTIAIGEPTVQQKTDYTHVLKGHIALASARFPERTHGVQLDAFARQFLWNEGLNYGHGTGHGIGHFLSVHEGPQNIRTKDNGVELMPGMLLSNEPGLYRPNEYGIRLENMVLVKTYKETAFGRFLQFETLSLFPFDFSLIDENMLSGKERAWLNDYHQLVYEKLSPFLPEEERAWLRRNTVRLK